MQKKFTYEDFFIKLEKGLSKEEPENHEISFQINGLSTGCVEKFIEKYRNDEYANYNLDNYEARSGTVHITDEAYEKYEN